jgi:hypothetical protein
MVFEHAIETVNSNGARLSFPLDRAYWMSGLEPVDSKHGVARFDGRSLAIPDPARTTVPETGAPATANQNYPYAMVGQAWQTNLAAPQPTSNGFAVTVDGAGAVTLDGRRMRLDGARKLTGTVTTGATLALSLTARWAQGLGATLDGRPVTLLRRGDAVELAVPAGRHQLVIEPRR